MKVRLYIMLVFCLLYFLGHSWSTRLNEKKVLNNGEVNVVTAVRGQETMAENQSTTTNLIPPIEKRSEKVQAKFNSDERYLQINAAIESIDKELREFNYPHSVINGHLTENEKEYLISLLSKKEKLNTEIFEIRYQQKRGERL